MPKPQVCPRCQRVNPGAAVFCYFDGIVLQQTGFAATPIAQKGKLAHPFIFPSRRQCLTMDDLVEGLHNEWDDSCRLLHQGKLLAYFNAIGRVDLAQAAREASAHPDPHIGLHQLLQALPNRKSPGPRLDLKPRRMNFGNVKAGEILELPLHVYNLGQGFLQGKINVTEGEGWVHVRSTSGGEEQGNGQVPLRTAKEQRLTIQLDTRKLRAPASHHARLVVITNGGITEVPIRLDLGSMPFPHAPFQGVGTPRELAEKMRAKPKKGVPLLESGEIRNWFQANGWDYPVDGVPARGIAAVQQFFEGMGLSKPPGIQLSEHEVHLVCEPPELIRRQIIMSTNSKKWVYGSVTTDVHWIRVLTPEVSGPQQTEIQFEIDSSLMDPDQIYEGYLHLLANKGQQMAIRVVVDVRRPFEPFTRRLINKFFSLAILAFLYRLLLLVPADLYARRIQAKSQGEEFGTLAFWAEATIDKQGVFLRSLVWVTWWIGPIFGAGLLWSRGGKFADVISGAVMGVMAGVIFMVTLGCVMNVIDAGPQELLSRFWNPETASGSWTGVWIVFVLIWWTLLGGVVGFVLSRCGKWGRRLISGFGQPIAGLLRGVGARGAANYLTAD